MALCFGAAWGSDVLWKFVGAQGGVLRGHSLCLCPKSFVMRTVFFHQSGQSPKVLRAKPVGLERTDSQTIGEFSRRRKGR